MKDFHKIFAERDSYAGLLGIEVLSAENGTAVTRLVLNAEHMNGAHTAHGGAVFSLADVAIGAAACSRGRAALVTNATISFMRPGVSGELRATARELSLGKTLGTYEATVTGEQGEAIAQVLGTVYRLDMPYPPED
jgi:acyl-CoA thioesterase